ncbi:DAGAT-domain-containing protein [Tothia fuscella]|uniref:Diacylglycerol O-acyltransferase n=1 Tax=Tothia fuscella TaxID=1048955 RepID=A0A9P4P1H7_9PEZI|nr:DAGAT-domain-containing protein [Tothia fuscella]
MPSKTYPDAIVESPPPPPKINGIHSKENTPPSTTNFDAVKSPGEYTGSGILDAPTSPVRGHKKVSSRSSRNSLRVKEANKKESKDETEDGGLVYEKYQDGNGARLTSLKSTDDYNDAIQTVRRELRVQHSPARERKLASGRVAAAGWETSGIRFAPLNTPLKRRLQTLMVLLHTLSVALSLTSFFWMCAIPLLWPLVIPYLIYILISKAGTSGELSYRSNWLRKQKIWSLFASYFPARLHRTVELEATRKYIFGYHPHGIISHGAFAAFGTEALGFSNLFPGITNTLLTLDNNFRVPIYRDYLLRMGLASVSRESCENILSKGGPNNEGMGRAITIVVGGAQESLETQPGTLRLILHRRKGFVKLAIRTGADLVPVLAFGENDIYEQLNPQTHPRVHKFQMGVKKLMGFTVPMFHARGIFNYDVGIMPYRRPMNIVVGRPIKIKMQVKPEAEYLEEMHAAYAKELRRLWDTWKDVFAQDRVAEMEVIE